MAFTFVINDRIYIIVDKYEKKKNYLNFRGTERADEEDLYALWIG